MGWKSLLAAAGASLGLAGPVAAECAGAEGTCPTELGDYHIRLPDTPEGAPMVIFLHGHGGRGSATMGNARLVDPLIARGYAVIAPEGLARGGTGPQSWSFLPGRGGRDDTAFLTGVARDAAERFGLDADMAILSGFSAGGFMVSYLACATPEAFTAYAPVAGGFWRPQPDSCAGPVRLFHTHGWQDTTVPLEGRYLGGGAWQQGDIFAGMELWRQANACADEKPTGFATTGTFMRRRWTDCAPGSALEFALFPGGHTVPGGWAEMMVDWFEDVTG